MKRAAPLRFLALALGGWVALRAALLWPDPPGLEPAQRPAPLTAHDTGTAPALPDSEAARAATPPAAGRGGPVRIARQKGMPFPAVARSASPPPPSSVPLPPATTAGLPILPAPAQAPPGAPALAPLALAAAAPSPRRWSAAAWMLVRGGEGAALTPAGTLGASQAGGRIWYRLAPRLALSARLYRPLRQRDAGDVAAGLDWQPLPALPLHLLAERRQAIGRAGRSDFSLTLYGGLNRNLTRRLRLDAYGQAGIVGLRQRDLFVDGSAILAVPLGRIALGGGLWGAAQPRVSRVDAGPSLSYRLPAGRATLRLEGDWRFRLAGAAAPGSGPAVTLAMDF